MYNTKNPIIQLNDLEDSFANCCANLQQKNTFFNVEIGFGGPFYGKGTYVLEQLIGHDAVSFIYKDEYFEVPLFDIKYGLDFCRMYFNYSNPPYKVYSRKK
jgi:hypothetical protein